MKRLILFTLSIFSLISVSCQKEILESTGDTTEKSYTFTLNLSPATKTAVDGLKTSWVVGDVIAVTNGSGSTKKTYEVTEDDVNEGTARITVEGLSTETAPLYVIYPASMVSVASGTISITIPSEQDGTFSSADVIAGIIPTGETCTTMSSVVAIAKVSVIDASVNKVILHSTKSLTGKCTFNKTTGKIAYNSAGASTSFPVNGTGTYYAAIIPGEIPSGFSMLAESPTNVYKGKTSKKNVTVNANDLVDFGAVSTNEAVFANGTGTETDPFTISNLEEWNRFAGIVNSGNGLGGRFVKAVADIAGIETPAGRGDTWFSGSFDGDSHTFTLDIDSSAEDYVGLFGDAENCTLKNIVTAGSVTGKEFVGGIVGYGNNATITNCSNSATITGVYNIGGIAGKCEYSTIDESSNNADVTGSGQCGGMYAKLKTKTVEWGNPAGTVQYSGTTSYRGVGGISGFSRNSTIKNSVNDGNISGVNKVGGIYGGGYVSNSSYCTNNGAITGTSHMVGGIAGYVYNQFTSTNDSNNGTVTGTTSVGGILGMANLRPYSSSAAVSKLTNANNAVGATITASSYEEYQAYSSPQAKISAAGGILGCLHEEATSNTNYPSLSLLNCENNASVSGNQQGVGGILGICIHSYYYTGKSNLQKNTNRGNVTADCRVGGIVGMYWGHWAYYNSSYKNLIYVRDSENTGTVRATNAASWGSVGGIIGWSHTGSNKDASAGARLYNNLNMGTVYCQSDGETQKTPAVGGIAGYVSCGIVQNCYNGGNILSYSGGTPSATHSGSLVGYFEGTTPKVNYSYFLSGTANQATGTSSNASAVGTPLEQTADGITLASTVTGFNSVTSNDLVTILNSFSDKYASTNYYTWKAGPSFDK